MFGSIHFDPLKIKMNIIILPQEILMIVVIAAITDNVSHKSLMRTCKKIKDIVISLVENTENEKYRHLRRSHTCFYGDWFSQWFYDVAKNGYISMLISNENLCRMNIDKIGNKIMEGACHGNNDSILEWALKNNLCDTDPISIKYLINSVCSNGNIRSLLWINNKFDFVKNIEDCIYPFTYAAAGGHIEIVKFFVDNGINKSYEYDYDDIILQYAARGGNLEIIKIIINHSADCSVTEKFWPKASFVMIFVNAASCGHVHVIEFLIQNEYVNKNDIWGCVMDDVLKTAANKGYQPLLQYLKDIEWFYDCDICYEATSGGWINVLQWAKNNGCEINNTVPMAACRETMFEEKSVSDGKFECLKFAYANGAKWDNEIIKELLCFKRKTMLSWLLTSNIINNRNDICSVKDAIQHI